MAKGGNRILTDFPKRGNRIDWKSTVGMEVELIYNDKLYVVKIVGYEYPVLKIEYNKTIKTIKCDNFIRASVGGILNLITKDFKIEVGEQIGDIIITDRKYKKTERADYTENRKFYKYKCNKCGWDEGWIVEGDLLTRRRGCSCCANKTVVENINSIWVTDRWMCDLGLSEKDAKTHTKGSADRVVVICPHCGKGKEITIGKLLNNKSIGCTCGDGSSYPEKFMTSVLDQLNIEYIFQLTKTTFDWCGDKKYDFYIPLTKSVLETHGMQHYKWTGRGRTLEEEQENDRIKYELALQNGIKEEDYIVIDCRYSDKEWIKNNILKSKLNKLFDLSKVDWFKCEEFAINSNRVKEVCDYWNSKEDWETTTNLMKVFKLSRDVIIDYLKKGTELGWCNYNGKEERINNYKKRSKPVAIFKDGEPYISEYRKDNVFESATEIDRLSRENIDIFGKILNHQSISLVCNGKRKTYNGYIFKFVEE